jgi:hypothetical protein
MNRRQKKKWLRKNFFKAKTFYQYFATPLMEGMKLAFSQFEDETLGDGERREDGTKQD